MPQILGMSNTSSLSQIALLASVALAASLSACLPTSHAVAPSSLGVVRTSAELEAIVDVPGPVSVESVVGAEWQVDRSGLINLDHPRAKAAKLKDSPEAIVIEFHAIKHPTEGLYLVDTGVEKALRDDPSHAALRGIVASVAGVDKMKIQHDTAGWISAQREPVKGVFLTHLHLDHVSGMRDVPNDAKVFVGPGESTERSFQNLFIKGTTDDSLEGKGALYEWRFARETGGTFAGVIDVFGDRTVWAVHVPGHTPGSTAYVVRTPSGPVLMTGDACHTTWGWENDVEPGAFSSNKPLSATSLANLRAFAARHPTLDVRLGHQILDKKQPASTSVATAHE